MWVGEVKVEDESDVRDLFDVCTGEDSRGPVMDVPGKTERTDRIRLGRHPTDPLVSRVRDNESTFSPSSDGSTTSILGS